MANEIRANYEKQWLFPPALEDLIEKDHPARFIREFVDALDLEGLGFRVREAEQGRPSYAVDLLLKVWLYGYFQKIRSSRGLERGCREAVGLLWLTGMNEPDHNTLWRFWRDHKTALRQVFRQAIQIAMKAQLVGLVLHAVDGTKVISAASPKNAWHRQDMEKLLARIDGSIDEVMQETEQAEKTEVGEYRLPADLAERSQLRQTIQSGLQELDRIGRDHGSKTDRDARMMKTPQGIEFAYNAQAVADGQSGLIVAAEVLNVEDDHHLLIPMLEQVKENIRDVAQDTLADAGYATGSELETAQEKGYGVVVNIGNSDEDGEFAQSRFSWNAITDQCICPRGEILEYESRKKDRRGEQVRIYRCQSYANCPVRWQCSKNIHGRTVALGPHHLAWKRQREIQRDIYKQQALKKRGQIIERIFGWLKQDLEFRRWTVKGLENVRTQWMLLCTTLNLRILYRAWATGQLRIT